MMTKVTTKTKKEFMVLAAVERGLFKNNVEASKVSNNELYKMIKEWDSNNATPTDQISDNSSNGTKDVQHDDNPTDNSKKRKLPKKYEKKQENTLENNCKTVVEKQPEVKVDETPLAEHESSVVNDDSVMHDTQKVETVSQMEQTQEEKEIVKQILSNFEILNAELGNVRRENKELKARCMKLETSIENNKRHEVEAHNALTDLINKVANTKDEKYVWVWKELVAFESDKFNTGEKNRIILDIEKLIIEDTIRQREEDDIRKALQQKRIKSLKNDCMYDGNNISYIDGEVVKPKGVKKKVYESYLEWYNECVEWVDYVVEKLTELSTLILKKKYKKAVDTLVSELDDWYRDGWYDSGCDDETVEMVMDVMNELVHVGRDADMDIEKERALSNLVAIIDGLELQ